VELLEQQIGACGIYCGCCKTFTRAQDRCLGCNWANKLLRKAREDHNGCVFWECVQGREIRSCLECGEFPCKTHYDNKEAVYTKQALDMWKKLEETGLTFGGRRKMLEDAIASES
jgi:hypothetical protein